MLRTVRKVAKVIYPPDMTALAAHPAAAQYALAYTGGPPARFPDRYAAVPPARLIAHGNPPALVLTGLDDSLVPSVGALQYVEQAHAERFAPRKVIRP